MNNIILHARRVNIQARDANDRSIHWLWLCFEIVFISGNAFIGLPSLLSIAREVPRHHIFLGLRVSSDYENVSQPPWSVTQMNDHVR